MERRPRGAAPDSAVRRGTCCRRLADIPSLPLSDAATIPTPHGEIELWMEDGELKKKLPEGIELL